MDIISHGFWSGMLIGKKTNFWLAVSFGILPDALAFTPFLLQKAWTGNLALLFSQPRVYPLWVYTIYNCTHSLVIAGLIFYVLCRIRLDLGLAFLAWPLHILFDIPTHSALSFPTKFLFPLSNLHFNGISWRTGYIFLGNWLAIAILFFFQKLRTKTAAGGKVTR